ncbi:unnamed protein product [Mytilus coruscus]|uniref:SAP domain-containing protein n=1 Tax=Mytilus coruscus TaxID=42192 RepID=A0A6J8BKI8_MYTCO|nr:unnamed protein product [Mytilus coruscus]
MDPGDQNTSMEEFNNWKTDNLQHYLTMKGLTKEGTKDELVALCFSAAKLGLPVKPNQSEVLLDNVKCYKSISSYCDIPDPLTLHSGWFDEKSGISQWPPTFLSDISTFQQKLQYFSLYTDLDKHAIILPVFYLYLNRQTDMVWGHAHHQPAVGIAFRRDSTEATKLLSSLLYNRCKPNYAMQFGLEQEVTSAQQFVQEMNDRNTSTSFSIQLEKKGFIIDIDHPYLGASVDRIVTINDQKYKIHPQHGI